MAVNAHTGSDSVSLNETTPIQRNSLIPAPVRSARAALTSMIMSITAATGAFADEGKKPTFIGGEYQVAQSSNGVEGIVAEAFSDISTTTEEMTASLEKKRIISDVSLSRQKGITYYAPYLNEYMALDDEGKYYIAKAIIPGDGHGGPSLSQGTADLILNLRIPELMIEAALDEAIGNGADADPDWGDIPAFREVLMDLRVNGVTESGDTFVDLVRLAPNITSQFYFVVATNIAQAENAAAQAENAAAQAENAAAQAENAAAQAENTTEYDRALDLTRIKEQQEEILGTD